MALDATLILMSLAHLFEASTERKERIWLVASVTLHLAQTILKNNYRNSQLHANLFCKSVSKIAKPPPHLNNHNAILRAACI